MLKENISQAELISKLKREMTDLDFGIKLIPLDRNYLSKNRDMLTRQWTKFFSDAETMKYLHPLTPFKNSQSGIPEKITVDEWLEERANSDKSVTYIVFHYNNVEPIGHLSLNNIDKTYLSASRGIVIGEPDFRGIGLGRSIGKLSIELARNAGLKKLNAQTSTENIVSIANLTRQFGNPSLSENGKNLEFSLDL